MFIEDKRLWYQWPTTSCQRAPNVWGGVLALLLPRRLLARLFRGLLLLRLACGLLRHGRFGLRGGLLPQPLGLRGTDGRHTAPVGPPVLEVAVAGEGADPGAAG